MDETDVYVDMESRVHVIRPKSEMPRRPSFLRAPGVYALATGRAGLTRSESGLAKADSLDQVSATIRSETIPPVFRTPMTLLCTAPTLSVNARICS